jgi:hypothetical protein
MPSTIELEIIGPVSLGGKRPGEKFRVKTDDEGNLVDLYWRRRLADERNHNCGAVRVVKPLAAPAEPPAAPAEEPPAVPASTPAPAPAHVPATRSKKA